MNRSTKKMAIVPFRPVRNAFSGSLLVAVLTFALLAVRPGSSLGQLVRLPGLAYDIGAGGEEIWIVGMNDVGNGDFGIYRWNGNGWEPKPGGAVHIAVGPAGKAWIVTAKGAVLSWEGAQWVARAQIDAIDIAVSGKGTFAVSRDQRVCMLNLQERKWEDLSRMSRQQHWSRLAAHPNGSIWVTTAGGSAEDPGPIDVFPPGDYEYRQLPGLFASDIAIGKNGTVWMIGGIGAGGGGYGVYQWRGRGDWKKLEGAAGEMISVDGHGIAWIVARDHSIWRCSQRDVLPLPTPGGRVTFFNEAGYVSRYTVSYVLDGKPSSKSTGNMSLGNTRSIDIPPNAVDIVVKGEGQTGLVWEPWRKTFEKKYSRSPTVCFKSYGTTLSQKWNNNCAAAVTKDDMEKFFEVIGSL